MLDFGYYNMDCMKGMKEIPDKFFDLAIVDPPYGIDIGSEIGGVDRHSVRRKAKSQVQIGGATPFGSKSKWGGAGVVNPKDIRRSMTVTHRTPRISKNCNV
jgi:DNA modification methylase